MKELRVEVLSQSSVMFGLAYERMIFPHPDFKDDVHLTVCTEFRIGLLFLQIRLRFF